MSGGICLIGGTAVPEAWRAGFAAVLREEGFFTWNADGARDAECAIVARPQPGALATLRGLRLVSSVGMGADHILADPDLPAGVAVMRVVTQEMVAQVAEYIVLAVLRVERDSDRFDHLQRDARWERRLVARPGGRRRVGLLGLGAVGAGAARHLVALGFPVSGWSRTARGLSGVTAHAGEEGLARMLAETDILVCALPRTRATEGILDRHCFARLPPGAHVVNVGRGEHLVEADLLAALDAGHVSGATLDVFRSEPLPPGHPFWRHPAIRITPHSAGLSTPEASARRILENLNRLRGGEPLLDAVERGRGY
ncbi:MAG: glyoxylate/hydroxypyruvate reductase A [Alphaproteobacteria bacterium]|nr:glyoxylate/hydroxypyruvate reductase A [Alphaproteobacteria bacterium]